MIESFEPWCASMSSRRGGFTNRDVSIGVSVYDTSSETPTANAAVRPNDASTRPTMPPMKATGTNTAISESVVASTAKPISFVPLIAASKGDMPFSSMYR